jgi:hypothetical protein
VGQYPAGSIAAARNGIKVDGKQYSAARLAWLYVTGRFPKLVSCKNRDRRDVRWKNLREVSWSQVHGAPTRNNKSGLPGVHFRAGCPKNPWYAKTKRGDGTAEYLGYFPTKQKAAAAYIRALKQRGRIPRAGSSRGCVACEGSERLNGAEGM